MKQATAPETVTYISNTATSAYSSSNTTYYALNRFEGDNIPYSQSVPGTESYMIVRNAGSYSFYTSYKVLNNGSTTGAIPQWTLSAITAPSPGKYIIATTSSPAFKNYSRLYSFNSPGGAQTYKAIYSCKHKMEAWGAQGVTYTSAGGRGGYTYGIVNLSSGANIYIFVGGTILDDKTTQEKFGSAYNNGYTTGNSGFPGGGATHIARTNRGELYNYETYKDEIYIVAGGGGAGESGVGGAGGGITGQNATAKNSSHSRLATGGAQSMTGASSLSAPFSSPTGNHGFINGSFGRGGQAWTSNDWGCGGGGGWFGGGGSALAGPGAGGSGHVGSVDSGETIQGTVSNRIPVTTASNGYETGHSGYGNARITILPYD